MLENVAHPLNTKHYSLNTTHYLKQRFILVFRPMLGQSAGSALDVKAGKACRTACLRTRIVGSFTSKNSKNESLPSHREFISVYVYPSLKFFTLHFHWILHSSLPLDSSLFTLHSQSPLAFSNPLASGDFIPVKSVNISIWSLVLPRLSTFSRNALPTAGSSAPCLAK